jgi:hypothetical protein
MKNEDGGCKNIDICISWNKFSTFSHIYNCLHYQFLKFDWPRGFSENFTYSKLFQPFFCSHNFEFLIFAMFLEFTPFNFTHFY